MILLQLFVLLVLLTPVAIECYRDRDGDAHPNSDWISRLFYCICAGSICAFIYPHYGYWNDFLKFTIASGVLFTCVFNYAINWVHLRNRVTAASVKGSNIRLLYPALTTKEIFMHVVTHLSGSAWPDKTKWYRMIPWYVRLGLSVLLYITVSVIAMK